jgi:peptide/nickel transport system permease protein
MGKPRQSLLQRLLGRPAGALAHWLLASRRQRAARVRDQLVDSLVAGDVGLFVAAGKQMILPVLTLAIFVLAPIARMTRAAMLGVLSSDFIRTARASGLSSSTVLYRYAFRNAMLPVVTTMGMVFSFMLGSNVVIEKVFAWPGIGSFAVDALVQSDYAPVQGFVLVMAMLFVSINLMIDILYTVIDPRVSIDD